MLESDGSPERGRECLQALRYVGDLELPLSLYYWRLSAKLHAMKGEPEEFDCLGREVKLTELLFGKSSTHLYVAQDSLLSAYCRAGRWRDAFNFMLAPETKRTARKVQRVLSAFRTDFPKVITDQRYLGEIPVLLRQYGLLSNDKESLALLLRVYEAEQLKRKRGRSSIEPIVLLDKRKRRS